MTTSALTRPAHRLPAGKVLGTDIASALSVTEALAMAKMDWTVDVLDGDQDMTLLTGNGVTSTRAPGRRFLTRSDNGTILAMVGSRYETIDNEVAFSLAERARDLGATFAHAGELDHGRKGFMTMDIPEARVTVGGNDIVDFGIVITTGHASSALTVELSGERLVCTNGLRVGLGSPIRWVIPHTASARERIALAEQGARGAVAYSKAFAAVGEQLLATPMPLSQYLTLIDDLFPKPDPERKGAVTRWENRRADLLALFELAETNEDGRGTQYGALQALTEWDQWGRTVRSGNEDPATARARRQFDGGADPFTQRVYNRLVAA